MLGLDRGQASAAKVIEGSDATFATDVLEASSDNPVIVYFSAAWCGPCKTFGPDLESTIAGTGGKVSLVKIDLDANRHIAAQLGIQSIPAVFAFHDGRPVDGFVGARDRRALGEFVQKIASMAGSDDLDDNVAMAQALLDQGAAVEAVQAFATILGRRPDCAPAHAGMVRAYLALGDIERAQALLDAVPDSIAQDKAIIAVKAALELALLAQTVDPLPILRERVASNAHDHAARYDLSIALLNDGDKEGSIEQLLEIMRHDRDWNEGAARRQLMLIFDSLDAGDPVALRGRRAFSSMMFA